jgi:beta-galactosidase
MMMIDACWYINEDGEIHAVLRVKRDMEFPELPRFGLRLFLPKRMCRVNYYGLGPEESYVDKHQASWHGLFECHVKNMHEDYIRPQENGSHTDCDFVMLNDAHGEMRLTACSKTSFSFNASVYSQEELTGKAHNFELKPSGYTILSLDYRQNGIGSASCGPRLSKQYRFDEESFTYDVFLIPDIQDQVL